MKQFMSTIEHMKAMTQASWKQGEAMALTELPTPECRAREVRVRVAAIGVNPVDWKMREKGPLRLLARLIGPKPPVVVGVDFAGTVEAIGSAVSTIKVGDRVVGGTNFARGQRGSYADTVVVRDDQVCPLPDGFDLEIAGALPVTGVTAWMSVVDIGRIAKVDSPRVLVLGAAGGVGQLAVQIGKMHGAFVVGVCSGKNADFVAGLGADEVLDYTKNDPLVAAKVLGPFQVIVDSVGSYAGAACRRLLRSGGRHAMVAGDTPGAMMNVFVPPFTSRTVLGRATRVRLEPVVAAVHAGKVKLRISERLPLAEAERAHELSRSGRMTGKIILLPEPSA